MTQPQIDLVPLRAALPAGQNADVTLLVRIRPGTLPAPEQRPPLNLALVLDRSGSMSGEPLRLATLAARSALRQLNPGDRVAVVAFDDEVTVVLPSQRVKNASALARKLPELDAGSTTALHAGWFAGAAQVAEHLDPGALNRVILLSDGHANVGETRAEALAGLAAGLKARGIGTTALGLGWSYDEDLMRAMADAGDGNFEHIADPEALPAFFQAELGGLSRTVGQGVALKAHARLSGIRRVKELGGLPKLGRRHWQLPNLLAEHPFEVLLTLKVPAQQQALTTGVLELALTWVAPGGKPQELRATLELPVLTREAHAHIQENAEVRAALELMENAQAKQAAVELLDAGDTAGAQGVLRDRRAHFAAYAAQAPMGVALPPQEAQALESLADLAGQDRVRSRKQAMSEHYRRTRGRPE